MCTLTPADTWSLNKVTVGIHHGFLLAHRTGQPYAVAGAGQIYPVWVCQCQGRTSSFNQASARVCWSFWSHSLREKFLFHMWPTEGRCLCRGNNLDKFCICVWARLWQSEYSLQESAHSFKLCGSPRLGSSATWQSPLPSEPPHRLCRRHFFFLFKIKPYGIPKKKDSVELCSPCQELPAIIRIPCRLSHFPTAFQARST